MKYPLILATSLLIHSTCASQTYISPIIGVDFTEMKTKQIDPQFYKFNITDKNYNSKSIFCGIKLEQILDNNFSLSFETSYTRKRANAIIFAFVAYDGFTYKYFRNNLSMNYKPNKFISIGIGYNYNQIKCVKYTLKDDVFTEFISSLNDHGLSFSIGSRWKNLEIVGYFHKGINSNSDKSGLSLNPINSIGVYAVYRFKLFKINSKKKGSDCPKF